MKRLLLRGRPGAGFPLTIAVLLASMLLLCVMSEGFRLSIIAQGVRDAAQAAVIQVVNDNYDDVYHSAREGYASGHVPVGRYGSVAWEESVDEGAVYDRLRPTLGLRRTAGGYAKYSGGELEYSISNLIVTVRNTPLRSGGAEQLSADITLQLTAPVRFCGEFLPPLTLQLKTTAVYMPLF